MARNYIVIDTETAPLVKHDDGAAHPETSLVYDIGWMVVDGNSGTILEERSYLNTDVIFQEKLMNSAYYANKVPHYWEGIHVAENDAKWRLDNFLTIYKQFCADVREYHVKDVWAYNVRFDQIVLNHTTEYLSNGFRRFFLPYMVKSTKTRWRDIWDYASCITGTPAYVRWAQEHGFVSAKGNPSTSAEIVYRYLTNNPEYEEEHTALEDARIECEILKAAKKRHKKTRHSSGQGWRDAAKTMRTMTEE